MALPQLFEKLPQCNILSGKQLNRVVFAASQVMT